MLDIFKEFDIIDKDLLKKGVWVEYKDGFEVKVAGFNNSKFNNKLELLRRPYEFQIRHNTLSEETIEDLTCQAMAGTVLLDWRGGTTPFSIEAAVEALRVPKFFSLIVEISKAEATFYKENLEKEKEELKN